MTQMTQMTQMFPGPTISVYPRFLQFVMESAGKNTESRAAC